MIKKILSWFVTDRYIEGRGDGWRACEDMILKRAEENGLDVNKILEILQ